METARFHYEYEARGIVSYDTLGDLLKAEKIYHPKNLYHSQAIIYGIKIDAKILRIHQQKMEDLKNGDEDEDYTLNEIEKDLIEKFKGCSREYQLRMLEELKARLKKDN